jgi:hypothetical protein
MEMKLLKKQYPKANISYYFAKNPNGKNYVIQAKENGKVIYSSYKNKMATGGGVEKQNDTAKSLRERYRKLWRSLDENDISVLLNSDYAFEEAGDVLGNLETLQEDYKNWLKNKGYSSKDSWKHEKTFLSHPIIAKKLKAAFSEKNKLTNQEMSKIEKQLFSMYPVLVKVKKELDDYTGGPILAQKVYKSGKSWTIVVPNYDVRDVYLSLDEVNNLKTYIKESTSSVKMATGGGVETKKIKWKPSKNEKVEGFVSKSFPYSGKGDMLLTKAEFVKKWSPRIESWIGIKPNLSDVETFFPDYSMDFKFIGSDDNTYRIYSPGESAKSKQYVIQKFKANVQMAKGGGVSKKVTTKVYANNENTTVDIFTYEFDSNTLSGIKKELKALQKEVAQDDLFISGEFRLNNKNYSFNHGDVEEIEAFAKGGGVDSIEPEGYKKEDAIKYGKKLVDANLKYREIRNKIEENYAGLRSEIQDVLNKVLDYYEKKPLRQNLPQEDKTAPGRINELSATLLNQIKRYAKENYNEDVIDDTFILKGEEKNEDFQVKEVSIDTASGREIHITIQELFMKRGGELSKGIRAELEHKKTISKIYNREVSKSKAAELIAKDHLKEDPKYYSKLEQIEGKKFATGSTIEKFDIGDRVYLNTKKGKIEVIVTKYSDKWVQFDDLTKGKSGRWKATPEFKQEFDSFVNQPTSTTTTQPATTTSTSVTTNGFKVGDILEWKEDLQPLYVAKKGDKAKVIEIATEGEEYDIYVEWISATTQENGWYLSSMFVKAKNQVLPKSKTPQATSSSTIIENLEVYNENLGLLTWDEATQKVKELGEGWRLPTKQEFENILNPNRAKIPNLKDDGAYWSSTEYDYDTAWFFVFSSGYAGSYDKSNAYYVRAVRDLSSSTTSTTQQPASSATQQKGLPSTDPKTWNGEFKVGDRVKVRWDFSNDLGNGNAKVDYFSKENDYIIISIDKRFAKPEPDGIIRAENPSGFLYKLSDGTWEGKDLELITTSQTNRTTSITQQPAPKRQPKIEEPEPPKRKFKEGADYLKIFTEYFEKDTQMGRPVKSESFTKAIVNDFIIATEDIGGFSKDKLKEIKSFIDKE